MHIYEYIYIHIYAYINTCIYKYIYIYIHIHIVIGLNPHKIHRRLYMGSVNVYVLQNIQIYIYEHTHVFTNQRQRVCLLAI